MHVKTGLARMNELPAIGSELNGRYRLERVIEQGGMGIVYGARHVALDEPVAVKMLLPQLRGDRALVARFFREGRLLARIRSEHVVQVRDIDVTAEGIPYLVMEWLDGQDLRVFCAAQPQKVLQIAFAARCIMQACEALRMAHDVGVIHRDIKPSNLFLVRPGQGDFRVKVIDFGISKWDDCSDDDSDDRTKTGSLLGTIEYMSPEQIRHVRRVDARADIWSLGVTLYRFLTGRVPFRGADVFATQALIFGTEPVRPQRFRPDIPLDLESIVLKCLQKQPAERYGSVGELEAALSRFALHQDRTLLLENVVAVRAPNVAAPLAQQKPLKPPRLSRRAIGTIVLLGLATPMLSHWRPTTASVLEAKRYAPYISNRPLPAVSASKADVVIPPILPGELPRLQPNPPVPESAVPKRIVHAMQVPLSNTPISIRPEARSSSDESFQPSLPDEPNEAIEFE